MYVLRRLSFALAAVLIIGGCSAVESFLGAPVGSEPAEEQRHPDVLAVELWPAGERTYDVAVTISSPYDTPGRYADGWRVLAPDGTELGTHTLLHDHASEQPFTRTQRGLHIPEDVEIVTVEGRDQVYGFGGATVTVEVPA